MARARGTLTLRAFGRKLQLELHCLTFKAEGGALVGLIDKYLRLGSERLQLTAQFMRS